MTMALVHRCGGCGRLFKTPQGLGLHFGAQRRKHGVGCGEAMRRMNKPFASRDVKEALELVVWTAEIYARELRGRGLTTSAATVDRDVERARAILEALE